MSARSWTDSQLDAIKARRGTVLVSAAAGSGKTAVLVERVIERLTDDDNPCDADRLLVVTFTNAAAAEMRERIAQRVAALASADPGNARLQRQQLLLHRAHISTIHSFCSELIRENFYKLGIAPDYRIADAGEMSVLRSEAMNQVLEGLYDEGNPPFLELVEALSSGRDDSRLARAAGTLYDFVRSHPFPGKWLREKAEMLDTQEPVQNTPWGQEILRNASSALGYCISLTRNALALMQGEADIEKAYHDAYAADLSGMLSLQETLQQEHWDTICVRVGSFSFARLKPLRGCENDPLKDTLAATRKDAKSTVEKIGKLFSVTEAECREDFSRLSSLTKSLFDVVVRFQKALDALKSARRAADFSDLEHWTLRLLLEDSEKGAVRTETARELSQRFDEIMVDEYQDTNEAQDAIFRALSRNEENLFMVGDVKQSIYRFRQAMPEIFLRRRAAYARYDREKDSYPARIVLDRNFRSRKGVTDAVNFVFRQLMSEETGELDYTKEEELVPGAAYPEKQEPDVSLHILDLSDEEQDSVAAECRHIAETIAQMIGTRQTVSDGGRERPITFGDFAILLRSANALAPDYAKELQQNGVPAWADTQGGFFGTTEVSLVLSLLRVVDNPVQDIPLLAVLMSPIYGFTPDDMTDIRLCLKNRPLYFAVRERASQGDPRCETFFTEFERFRRLASTMPSDRFLEWLYDSTGYPAMVQTMKEGQLRLANLRLLLSYARKYESSGYRGLAGFIRFIDRLEQQNADLAPANSLSASANAVKIMSIHRSKGLEFPVCILAGCSRRFNRDKGELLLHPELGLGIKLRDPETAQEYTTLPRDAISLALERGGMSEELRVLYVALTRAKEKLIMVTSLHDVPKTLSKLAAGLTAEDRLQPYAVRSAGSISDWILSCALRHPSGAKLRELAGALPGITAQADGAWDIQICRHEDQNEEETKAEETPKLPADPALVSEFLRRIDYIYPAASLRHVPSKVAASELAREKSGEEYVAASRPAFMGEGGLTPAERGTAIHAYMQFADYAAAVQSPETELSRLQEQGYLTADQSAAVDMPSIRRFFGGSVSKRILSSPRVLRELRFTVEIPASRVDSALPENLGREPVVLQGAVDCAFEEDGGLILVDYKTDHVKTPEDLKFRYAEQLKLYEDALYQCTGLRVTQKILYSFALNSEIIL